MIVATDFFTVEVWTRRGLQRFMVLFFIDLSTGKVEVAGIAQAANGLWMSQIARNPTDSEDGIAHYHSERNPQGLRNQLISTTTRPLPVHADTISIAIAEPDSGEVRSLGVIANQPEQIGKLIRKLGPAKHLQACYEAGPTGYGLYWQLTELGFNYAVICPQR